MADDTETETIDPEAAFIDRMTAKFEAEDAGEGNKEGIDEQEQEQEQDEGSTDDADDSSEESAESTTDSDNDTEEHAEADTSTDDSDGSADESGKDSTDDKDADHPEGDEKDAPEESRDDAAVDDETETATDGEGDDDEDEPLSAEFEAAAARLGIPLTIDDVPEGPARQLVAQKFKGMDSAFTRAMQELRSYRADEIAFRAEQKFRAENPDLVIAELLQQDPTLIDRVNERTDKLADPDNAKAFEIVVKATRDKAAEAIQAEIDRGAQLVQRADHVETLAKRLAKHAALPWEFAESAVERALLRKDPASRDLSDAEVQEIVKVEATNYSRHVRAHRREESKKVIQQRTSNRKVIPGAKAPSAAASPKPGNNGKKRPEPTTEEQRHARMMELARKQFPGAKDE